MRHRATRDLCRYWNELRGDRASPEREEIDPRAMRHVLPDTFLIETRPNGEFRVRLSGTRVDALWMAPLKDRCFLDCWADDRHSVAAALWTVMDGTVPVLIGCKAAPVGRTPVEAEVLLLPLRHNGKTHSLVLGTLSLAEPPSWIGLSPLERLRLVSLRVLAPAEVVDLPVIRRPAREGSRETTQQHGHLTVHTGGRASGTAFR